MIFLKQILFKYHENLGICYILYYFDIHQKELKSIQPVLLNPGAPLLFVAVSSTSMDVSRCPDQMVATHVIVTFHVNPGEHRDSPSFLLLTVNSILLTLPSPVCLCFQAYYRLSTLYIAQSTVGIERPVQTDVRTSNNWSLPVFDRTAHDRLT